MTNPPTPCSRELFLQCLERYPSAKETVINMPWAKATTIYYDVKRGKGEQRVALIDISEERGVQYFAI